MKPILILALVSLSITACGKGPFETPLDQLGKITLGPPPVLSIVNGNDQAVPVGSQFGQPVQVRLVSSTGVPMLGKPVKFLFIEPQPNVIGGGLSTYRDTNSDGIAEIKFTTTRVGTFTVTASYPECVKGILTCGESVVRTSVTLNGTVVAVGG